MNDTIGPGLKARILAATLEVSHLKTKARHPSTLAELTDVQRLIDAAADRVAGEMTADAVNNLEVLLRLVRQRLRAVHNAVADFGPHVAIVSRSHSDDPG
jgi:hypothetical protein